VTYFELLHLDGLKNMSDFRLPPRSRWELHSSG